MGHLKAYSMLMINWTLICENLEQRKAPPGNESILTNSLKRSVHELVQLAVLMLAKVSIYA